MFCGLDPRWWDFCTLKHRQVAALRRTGTHLDCDGLTDGEGFLRRPASRQNASDRTRRLLPLGQAPRLVGERGFTSVSLRRTGQASLLASGSTGYDTRGWLGHLLARLAPGLPSVSLPQLQRR